MSHNIGCEITHDTLLDPSRSFQGLSSSLKLILTHTYTVFVCGRRKKKRSIDPASFSLPRNGSCSKYKEERKRKPMPTLFVSFPPLTEKAQKKKKQVKLNKLREYSSSELK